MCLFAVTAALPVPDDEFFSRKVPVGYHRCQLVTDAPHIHDRKRQPRLFNAGKPGLGQWFPDCNVTVSRPLLAVASPGGHKADVGPFLVTAGYALPLASFDFRHCLSQSVGDVGADGKTNHAESFAFAFSTITEKLFLITGAVGTKIYFLYS